MGTVRQGALGGWGGVFCFVIACGSSGGGAATNVGGGGHDGGSEGSNCFPQTCTQLAASCGELVERCGTVLSCGTCPEGQTCGAEKPNVCDEGTCVAKTCTQLGAECGLVSDGCAAVIDCGVCADGVECGLSAPNRCEVCVPDCAGRECGPDGCGSTCSPGCGPSDQCSPAGVCEPVCPPSWQVSHGSELQELALHDGRLFVVGTNDSKGWVGAFSPCSGALEAAAEVTTDQTTGSRLMSLFPSGDDLVVVGDVPVGVDPRNVLLARMRASNLSVEWTKTLRASDESDEGWGVAVASDGFVWVAGKGLKETGTKPWAAKVDPGGTAACGFITGQSGHARAVAVSSTGVYLAGSTDNNGSVVRFDESSCSTSSPCECVPDWTAQPVDLGEYTEFRALEIVGSSLYAGGFSHRGNGDYAAVVAQIDDVSGETVRTWEWNPTGVLDAVHGLASGGQRLYVTMGINSIPGSGWGGSRAVVAAMPLDLDPVDTPLWTTELPAMSVALDVAADATDGLFVAGQTADAGWVARCTKDGVCPP